MLYTTSLYWKSENPFLECNEDELIDSISKSLSTYEVTGDAYNICKLYFDVDYKIDDADPFSSEKNEIICEIGKKFIYECVNQILGIEPIIAVATSSCNFKYSWRYFVPNIKMRKFEMCDFIKDMNKCIEARSDIYDYIENRGGFFDTGIYDHNRKMRCINTSKPNENRPLILVEGNIADTFITGYMDQATLVSYGDLKIQIELNSSPSPTSITASATSELNDQPEEVKSKVLNKYLDYATIINKTLIGTHTHNRLNRFKFITASKRIGIPFEVISKIMDDCPNNDNEKNREMYNKPSNPKYKLGWNTIKQLASLSNKEEKERMDIKWSAGFELTESGIAELMIDLEGYKFVYQNDQSYIYHNNEWKVDNKNEIWKYLIPRTIKPFVVDKLSEISKKFIGVDVSDKPTIKKLEKEQKEVTDVFSKLSCDKFISEVVKQIKNILKATTEYKEFDTAEDQYENIHFKNGCLHIPTGAFRKRTYDDFVTKILDYNYIPKNKIPQHKLDDVFGFFKKLQPKEEQRNFQMAFLALCLTGNSKCKFKNNIGYSASNGKSTEMHIFQKVLPIYTAKLDNTTFDKGNTKRHKHISSILHNPIRLAYIEELKQKKIDADFLKEFVDCTTLTNEVMYGTTEELKHQAKLATCSNKDINVDGDAGVKRRGLVQHYTSRFVDKELVDESICWFEKIENYEHRFEDEEYKNAFIHTLLPYYHKWSVPKEVVENFSNIVDENDTLKQQILEGFKVEKDGKTSKSEICEYFGLDLKDKKNAKRDGNRWLEILGKMKEMGLTFIKDRSYKGNIGVVEGLVKKVDTPPASTTSTAPP